MHCKHIWFHCPVLININEKKKKTFTTIIISRMLQSLHCACACVAKLLIDRNAYCRRCICFVHRIGNDMHVISYVLYFDQNMVRSGSIK